MGWMVVYLTLIAVNLIRVRSDASWILFYKVQFYAFLAMGLCTTIWFGLGALRDSFHLCRDLSSQTEDETDDGRVITPSSEMKHSTKVEK